MLKSRRRFEEIPSSSMSDIAFLLIVFFMVTTVFAVQQGLVHTLPGNDMEPLRVETEKLVKIFIGADGSFLYGGIQGKTMNDEDLSRVLQGDRDKASRVILIQVDSACPYQRVVDLFSLLKEQGFRKISLQSAEKSSAGSSKESLL